MVQILYFAKFFLTRNWLSPTFRVNILEGVIQCLNHSSFAFDPIHPPISREKIREPKPFFEDFQKLHPPLMKKGDCNR